LHHFKETDAGFGVSNLVWDKVFGTTGDATVADAGSVQVRSPR
jgi:sterol desaturase/sphingolipid hydroxylase (fatty acid hydroxylase superfamily)